LRSDKLHHQIFLTGLHTAVIVPHLSEKGYIIQLDNGGFHNSLNLSIPENVILLFQPAYSPEVNPIERLWGYVKEQLKWLRFDQIEELRAAVQKELNKLTLEVIASLTGWKFILEALSVAEI